MKGSGSVTANWLIPMVGEPVSKASLTFKAGKIISISSIEKEENQLDEIKTNSVLLPGFVNLHSHLDYSRATFNPCNMFDWIENLVMTTRSWTAEMFAESARWGAQKSLCAGTTFIVDSSYTGKSALALAEIGVKGIVGLEIFGIERSKSESIFKYWLNNFHRTSTELESFLERNNREKKINLTIAPHSPYTVSPDLFSLCHNWAKDKDCALLTHLAESEIEVSWMETGSSRLDRYLEAVIPQIDKAKSVTELVQEIDWKESGLTPVQSLARAGCLSKHTLCAHCVHLKGKDLALLKSLGAKLVHCPRSNINLENGRARLEDWQAQNISFGLGTDSLASTQSLSMLEEAASMVDLQKEHMDKECELEKMALRLITIEAAKTIGKDDQIGSIEVGKCADFVLLESANSDCQIDEKNIYKEVLAGKMIVSQVYVDGELIVDHGKIMD